MPIRLQLLLACILITMVPAALGTFALSDQRQLGALALEMYDQAFMSVNFLRSADAKFIRLKALYPAVPKASDIQQPSERQRLIGNARGVQPLATAVILPNPAIAHAATDVLDDLDVAIERAISPVARAEATKLRTDVQKLVTATADDAGIVARLETFGPAFDDAIEQFAQDGFEYRNRAEALLGQTLKRTRILIGAAMGLAMLITTILGVTLVPPIRRAVKIAHAITEGRLDNLISKRAMRGIGELAALTRALSRMQEAIRANLDRTAAMHADREAERVSADVQREASSRAATEAAQAEAAALVVGTIGAGLERLAAGDLTYRVEAALPPAYETLRANLNRAMDGLQELIRGIVANTAGLQSGTGEITQAADDLSRRTEQQAASLEQTAAALDEITATVRATAEGAEQARSLVSRATADAERSGAVVQDAVAAMGGIAQSSQKISQIIGVVDEIAFQTNLLALNAGVEAARAGDAGRGFAVVASEVRALAQRSAEAAREIKALIHTSTQQVGSGVKLVGDAGQTLRRIMAQVDEVSGVVARIASSAREQALGLAEVNIAVNQMDQMTQQNAAMVEQSTAASHALAQDAEELAQLAQRFQVGDAPAHPAGPPTRPAGRAPALKVVGERGRRG